MSIIYIIEYHIQGTHNMVATNLSYCNKLLPW